MIYLVMALILPFLENLLWGLGLGSILIAGTFYLYSSGKLNNMWLGLITLFAVFIDISLHISLGTLIISLSFGLGLFFLISYIVPVKDSVIKFPAILFVFLFVHVLIGLISSWHGFSDLGGVLSNIFGGALRFAVFDLIIYVLLDFFAGRIGHDGTKIRL